jgi:Uma2 family endonuclease
MSTALTFPLMTAEQFFALPEPTGPYVWELHFGELVKVGRPKQGHYLLQRLIRDLLAKKLGRRLWTVDIEMPYGLTPGYDVRAADIGACLSKTFLTVPKDGYLIGSPDLVIQVKSRSNRVRKMEEDARLHITHGAQAVWLVKPERNEIIVITATSRQTYGPGDTVPLPGKASLPVSEIFPAR